jgi:hypothetical protein
VTDDGLRPALPPWFQPVALTGYYSMSDAAGELPPMGKMVYYDLLQFVRITRGENLVVRQVVHGCLGLLPFFDAASEVLSGR